MKSYNLLDKCEKSYLFRTKNNQVMMATCGRCPACLHRIRSNWSNRLDSESKRSVATLFVTLTYNNQNLPIYEYYDGLDTDSPPFYYSPNRNVNDITIFDALSVGIDVNHSNFQNYAIQPRNLQTTSPSLGFCCKEDVQKYLKRLRRHIEYDSHKILSHVPPHLRTFRYFIAAEYGPKTLRPHFHGLLYFQHDDVARAVEKVYHFEAWKLSCPTHSPIEYVKYSASSYVSKYIRKYDNTPLMLQIPNLTKTFHLCSRRPAIGAEHYSPSDFFDSIEAGNVTYPKYIVDTDTATVNIFNCTFPSVVANRYFPRPSYTHLYDHGVYTSILRRFFYEVTNAKPIITGNYITDYKTVVSLLPNHVKDVNDYILSAQSYWESSGLPNEPKPTLSTYADRLSPEYFWFGIPDNRRSIVRSILTTLQRGLNIEDYIRMHTLFHVKRKSINFAQLVNFQNNLNSEDNGLTPLDVSFMAYPSIWSQLPYTLPSECPSVSSTLDALGFSFGDIYQLEYKNSYEPIYILNLEIGLILHETDYLTRVSNMDFRSQNPDSDRPLPLTSSYKNSVLSQVPDLAIFKQSLSKRLKTFNDVRISNYNAYGEDS